MDIKGIIGMTVKFTDEFNQNACKGIVIDKWVGTPYYNRRYLVIVENGKKLITINHYQIIEVIIN